MSHNTRVCALCMEEINVVVLMAHTVLCYIEQCNILDIVPTCTCNTCLGRKTHDLDSINSPKREQEGLTEYSPQKKMKNEVMSANVLPGSSAHTSFDKLLDMPQIIGKQCLFCCTEKSKSQVNQCVPYINIGQHVHLMVCKKKHLTGMAEEQFSLNDLVDYWVNRVVESKDCPFNKVVLNLALSGEDVAPDFEQKDFCCDGHLAVITKKGEKVHKCLEPCSEVLWMEVGSKTKKEKKRFCKSSHLYKYLMNSNSQGK